MSQDTKVYIEDQIKDAYLDYSMSVIVGRALPDARDGLKPVHRRILFSMNENGMLYNKAYKKSVRIVGDVLGKYHPHGDQAVYLAMVRMAQNFSTRYPLVDGQGNFGSIDGDNPASMRYTEARMEKISNEMISDINKETVPFRNNFDETLKEPVVLPSKLPNLLLNGSSGIAVGMATNIPPHNLGEIVDASLEYIADRDVDNEVLMQHVKGPDFPTGGLVYGTEGIASAYRTGRGKVKIRARTSIEEKNGVESIIISDIPYQVNKSNLIKSIAELAKDRKIEGISDLVDESDRNGIRVRIDVKKSEEAEIILNKLFKFTSLEVTFGIIMLAIVNNVPKVLSLKEMISCHVSHRFDVITNRTKFNLKKSEARYHILQGFKIAIANIDEVVKLIKSSKDPKEAKELLISKFKLTEIQAKSILEMRLQKLTSMEVTKLEEELRFLEAEIARFNKILSDENEVYSLIKDDMEEIKNKYDNGRKSQIIANVNSIELEDMIKDEEVLITFTNRGYAKRINLEQYRSQNRGGKGYTGQNLADEDFLRNATYAKNLDTILLFTNKGKVYSIKAYQIPELSRNAKGRLLSNIVALDVGERVKSIITTRDMGSDKAIFFVTKNGTVKKTSLDMFKNINKSGIIAIKLRKENDLINVFLVDNSSEIFIATKNGFSLRFKSKDVRNIGRGSFGVRGIDLREDDIVVASVAVATEESTIFTISQKGYGKKSKLSNYKVISRGRKGVINMKVSNKTGKVVSVEEIQKRDEIILMTSKGSVIRTSAAEISTIGRATQGVRVMKLRKDEIVVDLVKIRLEKDEESQKKLLEV